MSDARDRENLAALDALKRAGKPAGESDPFPSLPTVSPADTREPPGPTRAAKRPTHHSTRGTASGTTSPGSQVPRDPPIVPNEGEPPYRCLRCGYGLFPQSGLRCTECGEEYSQSELETWFFDGDERDRLTRVLWLVHACLVVKAWLLVETTGFVDSLGCFGGALYVANGLMAIAACYLAARDHLDRVGGYYAIAGMVAGGMMCAGAFRTPAPATYEPSLAKAILYSLDALSGCLLLLAVMHPPDGKEIWRARSTTPWVLGLAIAVPMLLTIAYGIESRLFTGTAATPPPAIVSHVNTTSLGALIAIGIWIYVRQWVAGLRRAFYGRAAETS